MRLQLQNQAQQIQMQNQYNSGNYLNGLGGQTMTQEVAPVVYQGTVPNAPQGPLFSGPNFGTPNPDSSLSNVQRQELRNYLNPPAQRR